MRNALITVVGQKGSGKSTYVKTLVAAAPRVIIIDRMVEYDQGQVISDYRAAIGALAKAWRDTSFRFILRFTKDEDFREYFRFIAELAARCPTAPIALVVEEADFFMSPHFIEPTLSYLYRYGRHFYINLISVARGETDIHRDAIQNLDALVVFRQRKFSREMRERFDDEELAEIRELQTLTPGTRPVKGVHFLTNPADIDPLALWTAAQV